MPDAGIIEDTSPLGSSMPGCEGTGNEQRRGAVLETNGLLILSGHLSQEVTWEMGRLGHLVKLAQWQP